MAYRAVVPAVGRARVNDFLGNLDAPLVFANDRLQLILNNARITVERKRCSVATFPVAP